MQTDTLPADLDAALDPGRRFGGLDRLYGVQAANRIRGSHVLIAGLGGVGSWAAEALARCGMARLTLVDMDHVAESNINRQVHALTQTLGQSKVLAMRDRILGIHPACEVTAVEEFVTPDNWSALLPEGLDGVIDACDAMAAKVAMADWARMHKLPFVTVGAAGGKRHAHRVEIDDLCHVTHDPLLAQLRYQLRKKHGAPREGKSIGVRCVFSREPVAPPDASCAIEGDGSLNCHGYGSLVGVTATFGLCAATEMVNLLALSRQSPEKRL
jgi:tRNA A37 threonylcarbamoyladenosine dehydratase